MIFFPSHIKKSYRGMGGVAPLILNLGSRSIWVVRLVPAALPSGKRIVLPIEQEAWWALVLVDTSRRGRNFGSLFVFSAIQSGTTRYIASSPGRSLREASDTAQKIRPWIGYVFNLKYFWARSQNCEKRLLASSCLSVRPHGTARIPLDGFSWNLRFEDFSKSCR